MVQASRRTPRTSEQFREGIGDRIAHVRSIRGLTQVELAERIDHHRNMIRRYEKGEADLGCGTLVRLCIALRVSPAWLVFGVNVKGGSEPEKDWRPPEAR